MDLAVYPNRRRSSYEADGDAAQRPFGGVVRHAQAAIIEKTGERSPAIEAALDRLAISLRADSLRRCSRSQVSSGKTSGRLRSLRMRLRSCGALPLTSRSIAKRASMRSTTSIGA
jgi:hypothetical protein